MLLTIACRAPSHPLAIGFCASYTLNGFIHVLLVIAIVVVLLRVIQGRRPV